MAEELPDFSEKTRALKTPKMLIAKELNEHFQDYFRLEERSETEVFPFGNKRADIPFVDLKWDDTPELSTLRFVNGSSHFLKRNHYIMRISSRRKESTVPRFGMGGLRCVRGKHIEGGRRRRRYFEARTCTFDPLF
jgi:hypothetical protein